MIDQMRREREREGGGEVEVKGGIVGGVDDYRIRLDREERGVR